MSQVNVEIKAKCSDTERIKQILESHKDVSYIGKDHQIDTYFLVPNGRLKIRQGNLEKCMVFYNRNDQETPKLSQVMLYQFGDDIANFDNAESNQIKNMLVASCGIKTVVDKKRFIYRDQIRKAKLHVDEVVGLGSFLEIEIIDEKGVMDEDIMQGYCQYYMNLFGVQKSDLISESYSDMILKQENSNA